MEYWKILAIEKYKECVDIEKRESVKEIKLINAGKALAMSELLEEFGINAREYLNKKEK